MVDPGLSIPGAVLLDLLVVGLFHGIKDSFAFSISSLASCWTLLLFFLVFYRSGPINP